MSQANGGVTTGPVYSVGPDGREEVVQSLARPLTAAEQRRIFGGGSLGQTIELESIRRLDIKPGETLVATLPRDAHPRDIERVAAVLKDRLPDGVEVLVVSGNVDLSVIACQSAPA